MKRSLVRFLCLEPVRGVFLRNLKNAPAVGIEPVNCWSIGGHHIHYNPATASHLSSQVQSLSLSDRTGLGQSLWLLDRTGLGQVIMTLRQDGARSSHKDSPTVRGSTQLT
ncbi:hypothetical protein DPMN_129506 [Dreissena polymorpha]|uniref:Uncharacterized protein n=1 Tax=Dreissena polymorpha TaxID=45954 RepID=A0A9D4JYB4_DREPO|nr:hypothetical protein DPMN_129506 [Dreissena polymorpha]